MRELAARHEPAQLALDEARDAAAVRVEGAALGEEALEVLRDDAMEDGRLGLAATVLARRRARHARAPSTARSGARTA